MNCLKAIVFLLRSYTFISASLLLVAQILAIFSDTTKLEPIQFALHFYMAFSLCMVMINEIQVFALFRDSGMLSNWFSCGTLYSFLGVIALEENEVVLSQIVVDDNGVETPVKMSGLSLYSEVTAWLLVTAACFYVLLGFTCIQVLYRRQTQKEAEEKKKRTPNQI